MKNEKTFIQNTMILFISMLVTKIVGAIFKIPLTNILGGNGMGYFSTAYSLYSPIFALTCAGIPTVIVKLTAQNISKCNYANARKIKRIALLLFTSMGLIGTLVIIAFAKPFAEIVAGAPESVLCIYAIAPAVAFCCISSVYRGYYEGLCNMTPTAVSQVVEAVSRAIVGLFLAYFILNYGIEQFHLGNAVYGVIAKSEEQAVALSLPYSAAGAVLAVTISEIIAAVFLVVRNKMFSDGITCREIHINIRTQHTREIAKTLLKDSFPIAMGAIVINISSFIDLVTISRCINFGIALNPQYFAIKFADILSSGTDIDQLGNFMYGSYTGVVATVFMLIPSFTGMLGKSALPKIAAAWEQHNKKALKRQIEIVMRFNFLVGLPLYFGITALSSNVLNLLYASKANEVEVSILPLAILGIGGIALTLSGTFFSIFQVIGRSDLPIKLFLVGSAVKIIANVFLISIPEVNISGAAISTMLCYIVVAIGGYFALENVTGIEIPVFSMMFAPLAAGIWCGATALFTVDFTSAYLSEKLSTLISIGVGGIFYVILLIILGGKHTRNLLFSQKTKK